MFTLQSGVKAGIHSLLYRPPLSPWLIRSLLHLELRGCFLLVFRSLKLEEDISTIQENLSSMLDMLHLNNDSML
jgi:hypothetical protein